MGIDRNDLRRQRQHAERRVLTNHNHGTNFYNVPEMIGAGLGGAAGGVIVAGLSAAGLALNLGWLSALPNAILSGVPGYVSTTAGWSEGEHSDQGGQGTSGRKDKSSSGGCQ